MNLLLRLIAPFLYVLSHLPLRVFYLLTDTIMLFYPLISYRKTVVRQNIARSFPELDTRQISRLMKKFYHNFFDVAFETFKMFSSSPAWANKLIEVEDSEILEEIYRQRKSVVLVTGHLGNWELAGTRIANLGLHEMYAIYHPLTNPVVNEWFKKMRQRQGIALYSMEKAAVGMLRNRNKLTITGFIADQAPLSAQDCLLTFLHQPTMVFRGPALMANRLNQPLCFLQVTKTKRGRYRLRPQLLCREPAEKSVEELTAMHVKALEENIRAQPEIWLWSHRRWKRRPKWQNLMKDIEKNKPVSTR